MKSNCFLSYGFFFFFSFNTTEVRGQWVDVLGREPRTNKVEKRVDEEGKRCSPYKTPFRGDNMIK